MLDRIREGSKGPAAKIILFVIILTFALTGVSGYLGGGADNHVAEVNGEKISRSDFDRAYQNERARMEEQLGDFFQTLINDEDYLREFRREVLQNLIDERLATQYAREQGFRAGSDMIRDNIRSMSEFQIGGQFNNDRYIALLSNAGFTPEMFRDYMQSELGRTTFLQGLLMSEFALEHEVETFQRLQNQRRSGQYVRISADDYLDQVTVDESEIERFYRENEERFETDERVRVEYVELHFNDVAQQHEVSEDAARDYYNANPAMFRSAERREIAHILIEGNDDSARQRIEELAERIDAGEDFSELAAQYSDDTFSGSEGGALGRLERGMIDPDVEDAGFALEQEGEVSSVVQSEFGFHLVQLTMLRSSEVQPFDEVRDDIIQNLSRERAEQEYFSMQQALSRVAFEIPESLDAAADEVGASVQLSDWIERDGQGPFNEPRIMRELFSTDVLTEGMNSELIELDERSLVVRVAEYEPAAMIALDDVRSEIETMLRSRKARDYARDEAEQIVQRLEAADDMDELNWQSLDSVSRYHTDAPSSVVNQLFRLPAPGEQPSTGITQLQNGDVALVMVTGVEQGETSSSELAEVRNMYEMRNADAAYRALLRALRDKASISTSL